MQKTFQLIHRKTAALKSHLMWHYTSQQLGLILVSEYPKSGGTWVSQLLADYLELPYPRNQAPAFKKSVLHGHHFYSAHFKKPVYVLRDGRDVMVSFYHHRYLGHNLIPAFVLEKNRAAAPFRNFENVQENMPAFIDYIFNDFTIGRQKANWKNLTESYLYNDTVIIVKYEDLLTDAFTTMQRVLSLLTGKQPDTARLKATIEIFSFSNQSNRKPGEENKKSFLRKGVAQDWKNYFTKEACAKFDHYAGDLLVTLGYEKDRNWF